MIAAGYTGNKGKGGFYRDTASGREVRIIEQGGDGLAWRSVARLPAAALPQQKRRRARQSRLTPSYKILVLQVALPRRF